jgi:hypothetical protein
MVSKADEDQCDSRFSLGLNRALKCKEKAMEKASKQATSVRIRGFNAAHLLLQFGCLKSQQEKFINRKHLLTHRWVGCAQK